MVNALNYVKTKKVVIVANVSADFLSPKMDELASVLKGFIILFHHTLPHSVLFYHFFFKFKESISGFNLFARFFLLHRENASFH